MAPDQIRDVLEEYQTTLKRWGAIRSPGDQTRPKTLDAIRHAHWMVEELLLALEGMPEDKLNRWFGFIQGVLWATGIFSIDEMRAHNTKP